MSARIDIVNVALSLLGKSAISIADESNEARIMWTNYDIARDATLEEADWTFAIKRFTPAESSTAPAFGAGHQFELPSDIIRLLTVDYNSSKFDIPRTSMSTSIPQAEYVLEGRMILTNRETIYCRGIRRMEDEGSFSPLFAHAFAAKLASLCCYAITKSNTRFAQVVAMYNDMVNSAITFDGMQGRSQRVRRTNLQSARRGMGSY